jgi:hypothetical protein
VNLSPSVWLSENRGVYIGNASSMRDFRVQLRGSRSVLLFGAYLLSLITIALLVYSNAVRNGTSVSIVEAQSSLQSFYATVIGLLGGMICLVTPALSATSILSERQRKSLDLVFSAPVSPKYYLVGKMLSSYRYIWMLLVLSLPVTAACVVLGGASWTDVLVAYGLLSVQGVIFSSLALLISAAAIKPVSAIVSSYSVVLGISLFTLMTASAFVYRPFMGSSTNEMPFYVTLCPFLVSRSAPSYTILFGVHVSNVFFAILIALLISRLCLLAAGAILRPYGGTEVQSLRVNGLLYHLGLFGFLGYTAAASASSSASYSVQTVGQMMVYASFILLFITPNLAAFGYDSERRFWPSGAFDVRQTFSGRPGGALPYLLLLSVGGCLSYLLGVVSNSTATVKLSPEIAAHVLFVAGLWVLIFSTGRYASSWTLLAKTARSAAAVAFMLLVMLPPALLNSLVPDDRIVTSFNVWDLYLMRPLMVTTEARFGQAALYGFLMFAAGVAIHLAAERQLAKTIKVGTNPYASIATSQAV